MMRTLAILIAVFVPMVLEAGRSRANERTLRRRGAVEPSGDVYRLMQIAYPACFLAMAAEGARRGPSPARAVAGGGALFVAGKLLKYWAVATLGERWTFRVLTVPGLPRTRTGPYRWLRHPNYVGVVGELGGIAVLAPAPRTGALAVLGFGALMLARIRVEERALDAGER